MKKAHKIQIFKKSDKMKQTISQKVDSGRSMVEMLGVLAVIGVLSVASILGYRYAMAKWRANETVNELNIRAYDIATRFDKLVAANTRDIEMEMGDTTKLGYPITARISPQYEDYFEMFVSNVPTDVCKELLNSQWQAPYSIFVGVEEYEASSDICEQAENVELAYEFYKDLSTREEVPEETRHEIQRCYHDNHCKCGVCNTSAGLCESFCMNNESCAKDYDNPQWLKCCDPEYVAGGLCCASITEDGKCCSSEGNCCPPDKPLLATDNKCYACDVEKPLSLKNPNTCSGLCPYRYNTPELKICALCGAPGTSVADKPIPDRSGYCHSCSETGSIFMTEWWASDEIKQQAKTICETACGKGNWYIKESRYCNYSGECPSEKPLLGSDGNCYPCDYVNGLALQKPSTCSELCPKRYINNSEANICTLCGVEGTSVADKPVPDRGGNCHSCTEMGSIFMAEWWLSDEAKIQVREKCETACGKGKRYIKESRYCNYSGECPAEKPLLATDGNCYPCNHENGLSLQKPSTCSELCPKRYINNSEANICTLCGAPGTSVADKPIPDRNGNCHSCSETESIFMAEWWLSNEAKIQVKERCEAVCETGYRRIEGDRYCKYTGICPADKPLRSTDNICYSCDDESAVSVSNQASCTGICSKRYYNETDKKCLICGAPNTNFADKPLSDNKKCYSCDDGTPVAVKESAACSGICPKRFLNNETDKKCIICGAIETAYANKPLIDKNGNCHDCESVDNIDVGNGECETLCPNRVHEGTLCKRTSCLPGDFEGENKNCYPCNITTSIRPASAKECTDSCVNRVIENEFCILK